MNLDTPFYREKLTPHFARWEFVVSQTAARRGIDNTPAAEHWVALRRLSTACLEPAREALGTIHVNSGYRCSALNAAVGGQPNSQHMRGEAADLVPNAVRLVDLFLWLRKNVAFDQLIWEFGAWVHVSHAPLGPQRGEMFGYHLVNGSPRKFPISDEQIESLR